MNTTRQKILVLSHNRIGSTNNMGITLKKLFLGFSGEDISQISFREEYADSSHNTLVLTDKKAMKSIVTRRDYWTKIGDIDFDPTSEQVIVRKKNPHILILRDYIWKIGVWKTHSLNSFILENNIKAIFVAPGYSNFIYDIAFYIRNEYDLKLISYFADDYYLSVGFNDSIVNEHHQKKLKNNIAKLSEKSDEVIFISNSMRNAYENRFKLKKSQVLYTPYSSLDFQLNSEQKLIDLDSIKIVYGGNLGLGRLKTILEFMEIIKQLKFNKDICFEIYGEIDSEQIENLDEDFKDYFKGSVSKKILSKKMSTADILLHAESFESTINERIIHSFSTKLADLLVSGKQLLIIGPRAVHSINYFIEYDAGYVIDRLELDNVEYIFSKLLNDTSFEKIGNAFKIAKSLHNPSISKKYFSNLLHEINKK